MIPSRFQHSLLGKYKFSVKKMMSIPTHQFPFFNKSLVCQKNKFSFLSLPCNTTHFDFCLKETIFPRVYLLHIYEMPTLMMSNSLRFCRQSGRTGFWTSFETESERMQPFQRLKKHQRKIREAPRKDQRYVALQWVCHVIYRPDPRRKMTQQSANIRSS